MTQKWKRVPALKQSHPPGCPDPDWCAGNGVCYWDCTGRQADEYEERLAAEAQPKAEGRTP